MKKPYYDEFERWMLKNYPNSLTGSSIAMGLALKKLCREFERELTKLLNILK